MSIMNFDLWYEVNESDLDCEMAETGMDRELGFNKEDFLYTRYEDYVEECERRVDQ